MKKFLGIWCTLLLLAACTSEDEPQLIPVKTALENEMIKFTDYMGEWDAGVIYAEESYLLHKEEDEAEYLQFLTPNGEYDCAIYANKENYLPEMLCFEDDIYHFTNSGDTAIIVMHAAEKGLEQLVSIGYSIEGRAVSIKSRTTFTTITYLNRDDKIQKVVKALDAVLGASDNYTSSQIKRLKKALDDISIFYYYEDVESIIDELDLCREEYGEKGDSVIWCFSQYATKAKIKTYDPCRFGISVRTGDATDIYCNTAVINGRIYCPSEEVREKGRWGIIYSTSPDNLTLEHNEGCVYADSFVGTFGKKEFSVQLTGLEPNTTYYYKTFYDFTSPDHGSLFFSYGDKDADNYVESDWFMREFTTKEASVKISSFYSQDFWYELFYDEKGNITDVMGALYPALNINTEGINLIYGYEIVFKHSIKNDVLSYWNWNYKEISENGELFPISSVEELYGNNILREKWEFDSFISGTNAVKVILWLSPTKTIESDWYEFGYAYNKRIYSLN